MEHPDISQTSDIKFILYIYSANFCFITKFMNSFPGNQCTLLHGGSFQASMLF
nr:hypothetical protein SHINE37_41547 [Rhizobiaceae bacterium]